MKLCPPTVVVQDFATCLVSTVHNNAFDIVTNVFVLLLCLPWKGKWVRGNFTDFFFFLF